MRPATRHGFKLLFNPFADFPMLAVIATLACILILIAPPRIAIMAVVGVVFHATLVPLFTIGGFHFYAVRVVCLAVFIRMLVRGERPTGGINAIDRCILAMVLAALISAFPRGDFGTAIGFRLGFAYNLALPYFAFRAWIRDIDDVRWVMRAMPLVMAPLALEMLNEQMTGTNAYLTLSGLPDASEVRDGRIRSGGPFGHAILAGTSAAAILPLFLCNWKSARLAALAGIIVAATCVVTSSSSGPIAAVFAGGAATSVWLVRGRLPLIRRVALILIVLLHVAMNAPVWWLIARVDFTGSSTGDHRAMLIDAALAHLGEWWIYGTDYTRHWLPTGVSWSPDHTDITNHYLQYGVIGGLPLMGAFMVGLYCCFTRIGLLRRSAHVSREWTIWLLGSVLFTHAATFISVAYFDQSSILVFFIMAAIASLQPLHRTIARNPTT